MDNRGLWDKLGLVGSGQKALTLPLLPEVGLPYGEEEGSVRVRRGRRDHPAAPARTDQPREQDGADIMEHEDSGSGSEPAADGSSLRGPDAGLGGAARSDGGEASYGAARDEDRVAGDKSIRVLGFGDGWKAGIPALAADPRLRTICVPMAEIRQFQAQATSGWNQGEVGGMFAVGSSIPGRPLRYLPGMNVTQMDPMGNIELEAAWIAEKVNAGWEPLAFIHSHPGGQQYPSPADVEHFPWWLVETAFIWYGDASCVTQYWPRENSDGAPPTRRSITPEGLVFSIRR